MYTKLKVMKSDAGFYIGRSTHSGIPYSIESPEYYTTREEAETVLSTEYANDCHISVCK